MYTTVLCSWFPVAQLSPALRNRFTEVWCPPFTACAGLRLIAHHNLLPQATPSGGPWAAMMTEFMGWLRQRQKNFKFVLLAVFRLRLSILCTIVPLMSMCAYVCTIYTFVCVYVQYIHTLRYIQAFIDCGILIL